MNQYLLLRDNKQTGPYTAEELAAKGLKAYDLVWLQGKSAAWRYPSEIEELKSFAPVVEEQPYDRFYKKPGEQSATQSQQVAAASSQTTTAQPVVTAQQPVAATTNSVMAVQEETPVAKQVEQTTGKHIYVTMPVSKAQTANTAAPVAKKEEPKPVQQVQTEQNNKNYNSSSTTQNTRQKKVAASSYIVSQEDDELNSSMLKRKKEDDAISNGYLSDYEQRKATFDSKKSGNNTSTKKVEKEVPAKKEETDKKESYYSSYSSRKKEGMDIKTLLAGSGRYLQDNKNLTRSLVAAVLILGGVVIGLIINSGHRQPDNTQVLESLVKEIREKQNEKTAATAPTSETTQKGNRHTVEAGNNDHSTTPVEPALSHTGQAVIKKDNNANTTNQNKQPVAVPVSNTNTEPVETTPAVVVEPKEKTVSQEMLEKARKNIYDLVQVEASAFKVGLLGGVYDLDITILNSSVYPLDQVAVEVKYFGPEKKLVKSQTLVFNNVPAGKRRTLEAPRTNRGISIDYSIISINSKVLGLAQVGY